MSFTGHPDFARLNSVIGPPLVSFVNVALNAAFFSAVIPVADYETLEIWNATISAASGCRLSFAWYSDALGTAQLGGNTQCHTSAGKPFRLSIPVAGPYVKVGIEFFSYAASPLITISIYPRVGVKPKLAGAGDNNLVSNAVPLVASGGIAVFQASIVANGEATVYLESDVSGMYSLAVYTLYDSTTRAFAVVQNHIVSNVGGGRIVLPPHVVSIYLVNENAGLANMKCSVLLDV